MNAAWHGADQPVALLSGCGSEVTCIAGFCALLYALFTHDWTARHSSSSSLLMTPPSLGLITDKDESEDRDEVKSVTGWCQRSSLSQNFGDDCELQETAWRPAFLHLYKQHWGGAASVCRLLTHADNK